MRAAFLLVLIWLGCGPPAVSGQADLERIFSVGARTSVGAPYGWSGGPAGTIGVDSAVVRSAPYSARLQREADAPDAFSTLTYALPVTFTGQTIELRGWLRLQDVEGWTGLWLRQDGPGGVVGFDNMERRRLSGTSEWTEYRITLPLDPRARRIYLGALLSGPGTIWVDDIQLLVDGLPVASAPQRDTAKVSAARAMRLDVQRLDARQTRNIALAGRVWGFVKYHHPRVTSGGIDWDEELFSVLPRLLETESDSALRSLLNEWLAALGPPQPCAPCAAEPQTAHLRPELSWTRDTALLGTELSRRLVEIHRNRSASPTQHYRGVVQGVGNPDFSAEKSYADDTRPDGTLRILALLRFWNIIEYWFPYRDVIGTDWYAVLEEYLPRVAAASAEADYALEMIRLSGTIHDTHSNVWRSLGVRPPRGSAQLPVSLRFIDDHLVVTGYMHAEQGPASGLLPGDVIERIGPHPVDSLIALWRPYYSASNEPTRLRDMARTATRGDAGPIELTIRRGAASRQLTAERVPVRQLDLTRAGVNDLPGPAFRMLGDDVAYLKLSSIRNQDLAEYMRQAAAARVLVVDIRNYPSDFVVFTLGGRLVERPVEFARFTQGDPANPGAFTWTEPVSITPVAPRFPGRVVVLVDEMTQSQAEYTAMSLRAAGATIVGSTTAGADGNVSEIPLPGGLAGMISGIGVFYPDRTPTQRVGIIPDVVVRPTIAGIRDGRDEVLEAAVTHALGRPFRLQ